MNTHRPIVMKIHGTHFNVSKCISNGDKKTILAMIGQQHGRLRTREKDGSSLLHLLMDNEELDSKQKIEILSILLEQGIDPNVQNEKGVTVLHLAVQSRNKKAIDLLLSAGARTCIGDNDGNTPAHYFIINEQEIYLSHIKSCYIENVMEEGFNFTIWLNRRGFDFDKRNKKGENAVQMATNFNLLHVLPTLLRHCTDIYCVRQSDNQNLLHLLLEAQLTNNYFTTSYTNSIFRRVLEIIKILLDRGVSIDPVGTSMEALRLILQTTNCTECMVLDYFTNIKQKNFTGQTMLQHVIARRLFLRVFRKDPLKIIYNLIAEGSDVNTKDNLGNGPIHLITCNAEYNEQVLNLLLPAGCNVHATNNAGETALHLAIKWRNISIAQKLIRYGADVNCREKSRGITPLLMAATYGFTDMMRMLLYNGADVNCKAACCGERPLHLIVDRNNGIDDLLMLLRYGAYVNARDKFKETAMSRAIKLRNHQAVKVLLECGADINDSCVIQEIIMMEKCHWKKIEDLAKIMSKHWIKFHAARLRCWAQCTMIKQLDNFDEYYHSCLQEVQILKNTTIDNKKSVYEWLHMDFNSRCYFIDNEWFKNVLESPVLIQIFPKYANVILAYYREAIARKPILKIAIMTLKTLYRTILPINCLVRITSFLSNADLLDLIENI